MSDRPTPITDALENTYAGFTGKAYRAAISACYNVECQLAERTEQRDRLADLLIESQSSIAGDWRTRRDDALAAMKGGNP